MFLVNQLGHKQRDNKIISFLIRGIVPITCDELFKAMAAGDGETVSA